MAKTHPNNPVLRNPKFAKLVFDQARQPIVWLFVSRRLRKSAKAIWKQEEPIAQQFWTKLYDEDSDETLDEPNLDAIFMLIATMWSAGVGPTTSDSVSLNETQNI